MKHTRIWSLAIAATLIAACSEEVPKVAKRTVIVGFDGMDPVIAQGYMDRGLLPNFQRLAEQGTFRPLATSNPPQSPVAWSSFATGEDPGDHGIYDFLRRHAETYTPDFSISENVAPDTMELFGLTIPLDDGAILNRRHGTPFWSALEDAGRRTTVLRVPVTFPPDDIHRMLAGMGVPDLLGTQGTYTVYTTRPLPGGTSSQVTRMRPDRTGRIETMITGPQHPLKPEEGAMTLSMLVEPASPGAKITVDDGEPITLQAGEWSDWVRLNFDVFGIIPVRGMVRFLLMDDYPRPLIYMSPIQIDPMSPVVPLSSPPGYAAELAERIGDYHTIGMPEETWSLNDQHIQDAHFLEMQKTILAEREAMFFDALEMRDSEVVIGVFVQTDRVSHMFYRGIDPEHPLHDPQDTLTNGAIEWVYQEADRILGQTMSALGPDDELIVISDHGFSPFRWAVNLNRLLVDDGYLVLKEGAKGSDIGFSNVDWSKSRAYALGLNGLYLNMAGREAQGIVRADEVEALKREISDRLLAARHGDAPIVRRVFDGADIYEGNQNGDAPDLVVGYHRGYRASWQTTLGAVPDTLVVPNDRKWSGDHCVDPELVPGVLFTSFPDTTMHGIEDVAGYVLERWK